MRMRGYAEIELAVRTMNWAHQGAGGLSARPFSEQDMKDVNDMCTSSACRMHNSYCHAFELFKLGRSIQ